MSSKKVWQNGKWSAETLTPQDEKLLVEQTIQKPLGICEDCAGTPHNSGDINDFPMQETPMQLERIYGKRIAEEIEMDDELAHRWDY